MNAQAQARAAQVAQAQQEAARARQVSFPYRIYL